MTDATKAPENVAKAMMRLTGWSRNRVDLEWDLARRRKREAEKREPPK